MFKRMVGGYGPSLTHDTVSCWTNYTLWMENYVMACLVSIQNKKILVMSILKACICRQQF